MKEKVFSIFLFLGMFIALLFSACAKNGQNQSNIDKFLIKDTITPQIRYIESNGNMSDIVILDDYYIIQSDVKSHMNQLSVYNKATDEHLYDFAMRGHGAEETIALDMLQNPQSDTIEIIDQSKYKILKYHITKDSATLIGKEFLKLPSIGPLQEVYRHNDSIIVFNTLDSRLIAFNDISNMIISEINFADSLKAGGKSFEELNYHLAYCGGKICLGFRHFNLLVYGTINNAGHIQINDFQMLKHYSQDADMNIFHYIYVDMNEEHILAQYMGYNPGFIQKMATNYKMFSPKFDIEIYSADMTPFKHIVSSTDILRCKLDRDLNHNSIYSWNPLESKENILKFEY